MKISCWQVANLYRYLNGFWGIVFLVTGVSVLAQTPPDAGSLLHQQEQLEKKLPLRFPETDEPERVRPALKQVDGAKVLAKAFRFNGAVDLLGETALQKLVKDAVGKELDFNDLQQLVNSITEYLRDKGFLLARAYLPRQDLSEGVIEIVIVEGRLDGDRGAGGWDIALNENARIDPDTVAAIVETSAPSGATVERDNLERALLLVNDLPGISARSRLEPGSRPGTTRIKLNVIEGPLFTGNIWADNYGNNSTGKEQLNATLNLNDPSGQGDQAILSATVSEGIRLARLGYSLPLGSGGLRASVGYTDMDYEVVEGSGEVAGLEGNSEIFRTGLSYPFIRTRMSNFSVNADLQRKALKDDSSVGTLRDKRVDVLRVGLKGDSLDGWQGGGFNRWDLALTMGDLDLSKAPADEAVDAASLRTQGNYNKLNLDLLRLQRLPRDFSLLGKFSAQWANDNLDSSEQLILGGPTGVRAYPVGEAQGDEGWLASLELRYDWPGGTPWGTLQLSAFADTGRIRLHQDSASVVIPTATGKNSYRLSGAGLGLSLSQFARHSVTLAWGHTIGDNDGQSVTGKNVDGKDNSGSLWLQAIVWF